MTTDDDDHVIFSYSKFNKQTDTALATKAVCRGKTLEVVRRCDTMLESDEDNQTRPKAS